MDLFSFKKGTTPLLVSIPHSGLFIPQSIKSRLTRDGLGLVDTDWHIPMLYDFLKELDCSIIEANYSRYVVDLNRPPDGSSLYPGKKVTGICSTETFMGQALYLEKETPTEGEIEQRKISYWQPYHLKIQNELDRLKRKFGYALLWDAHSIRSLLPPLFDGRLPDLNLGTADGNSCDEKISDRVYSGMRLSDFEVISNGRFKGGYITRHYGNPEQNVHAIQMEIAQIAYMSERSTFEFNQDKANKLRPVLKDLVVSMLDQAAKLNSK